MPSDKPTDLTEKTAISTNLRLAVLVVGACFLAGWYASGRLSNIDAALASHASAIQGINGTLVDIRATQEKNFERLYARLDGRMVNYPAAARAEMPAASSPSK